MAAEREVAEVARRVSESPGIYERFLKPLGHILRYGSMSPHSVADG